jgi:hypothetical protein
MANSICLSPNGQYLRSEAKALAAGILPGHLIQRDSSGEVAVYATADGKPSVIRVADINIGDAGDITRAYTAGENVHYVELVPGDYVTLRVGASQTITVESELASAGDGTVKTPAAAGTGVLFIADEAVTTGAGESAFIRAIVANF